MAFASLTSRARRIGRSVSAFRTSAVPAFRRNAVSRRLSGRRRPPVWPTKPAPASDRAFAGLDDVPALAQIPEHEVPDLERRHRGPRRTIQVPRRHPTPPSTNLEPVGFDEIDRLEQVELQGAAGPWGPEVPAVVEGAGLRRVVDQDVVVGQFPRHARPAKDRPALKVRPGRDSTGHRENPIPSCLYRSLNDE